MIKFPDKPFSLFVDVGLSHNAPHSQMVLATNPQAFVIGVEPNPNSCNSVRSLNLGDRFYLIEAISHCIAEEILNQFEVDEVTVRVKKPVAPLGGLANGTEIEITRQRS